MGMFDMFILKEKFYCPSCGKDLSEEHHGTSVTVFQTNHLGGMMYGYVQGETPVETPYGLTIVKGKIPAKIYCRSCRTLIDCNAVIDGGRFVRIEVVQTVQIPL